jgi:hypothetical protein
MNMKKLISTALALCLALTLNVPACGAEDEEGEWYDSLWADTTDEAQSELENTPEPEEEPATVPVEEEEATAEEEEVVVTVMDAEPEVPEETSEIPDEEPEATEETLEIPDEEPEATEIEDVPAAVSLEDEDLIEVSVPATGQIMLDPYGLSKNFDGSQLSHDPQALVNNSGFPVSVNVQLTGTVPAESEAILVDSYPAADCQEKEVFTYVEFSTALDDWADSYIGAENQMVALADGVYREDVMTLDEGGEGYFRFSGTMAAEAIWDETDTFGATLIFSFEPVYTDEEPVPEEEPLEAAMAIDEEPVDDAELPVDEDPVDETEQPIDEEPVDETEQPIDEEPVDETEQPVDEEPVDETETPTDEEPVDETEQPTDEDQLENTETPLDGEPPEDTETLIE